MPWASTDVALWIALRRADEGGIACWDGGYYDHGRPVPEYLNTPLVELVAAGRLELDQADSASVGLRRVRLTEQGQQVYALLCGKPGARPACAAGGQGVC